MRTYGAMQLIEGGSAWEMSKLEPHVAIRLKQLFPRVPKNSTGPFRFPRDLMHAADLDWFLTRYPLAMTAEDREALDGGRLAFNLQQAEIERILLPNFSPAPFVGLRDGQNVRHYQMQAVELVRRRCSLLLGDEGGLGKTYTAGAFLCAEPCALPAAVVCDPPIMDVLGIKASEARQIVDPHVGVQRTDNDTSNLRKLVERYLEKGKAVARGDLAKTVEATLNEAEQHALFE
ncbi:hypothetical protein [Pandoraea sp. ISTKB]|uniref:hypothetical protein n=1 Tax=Pandoraea sp. ISTKB TaxID=1586708 RepID=UPI0008477EE1|nr:hypothetical protein [Pandoraea sp. ISTKB]